MQKGVIMVIKRFSVCILFLFLSLCLASCRMEESGSNVDSDAGRDVGPDVGPNADCDDCHGFPPIPASEEVNYSQPLPGSPLVDVYLPRSENYPGGGGAHLIHVSFLRNKVRTAGGELTIEDLCAPCHGPNPGEAPWHNGSGSGDDGAWTWPLSRQAEVDIVDGRGNFGASAQYNGEPVLTGVGAKGGEPQQCDSFNCHGAAAPYNATPFGDKLYSNGFSRFEPEYPNSMRLLWDFACEEYANDQSDESVYDEWSRDIACAGCHGHNPELPDLRTRIIVESTLPGASEPFYDSDSPDPLPHGVAANYFGTLSGYARGGHGDAGIQDENPFHDSAQGASTPLGCTACHDSEADHFPVSDDNIHRLINLPPTTQIKLESSDDNSGICTQCHEKYNETVDGQTGPLHHPSSSMPIIFPDWWLLPDAIDQSHIVATAGDVDGYIDSAGHLPRFGDVFPLAGSETELNLSCVTCLNPHGSDLPFPASDDSSTLDFNMLRLYAADNTLCSVCHY